MVARAKSKEEQARLARAESDKRSAAALAKYTADRDSNSGASRRGHGANAYADSLGVSGRTLNRYYNGGRSLSAFNKSKRKLLPAEEEQLLQFALVSADRGFGFDISGLERVGNALLLARDPASKGLGHNWIDRFIVRNPELKGHWSRALAKVRANAANPESIYHFYDEVVWKHIYEPTAWPPIPPERLYASDEIGVSKGFHTRTRILGRADAKMAYQQGVEDRENITVLPTICADGTWLPPLYIFAGQKIQSEWRHNNVLKASFAVSPNGWTDNELALWWLINIFDQLTRDKANGEMRALFLDGHGSHLSLPFLRYAKEHNIIILAYPPHTTHLLQGLDVVAFAQLKRIYAQEVKDYEELHGGLGLRKRDFAKARSRGFVFGTAFQRAFTEDTVQAAFRETGIFPFNRNAVSESKMRPSQAASMHHTFPIEQPSPVRRVMASQSNAVTAHPRLPETRDSTPPIDPVLLSDAALVAPQRPRLPSHTDFTPGSRWRTLEASLSQSATASILVSDTRISSAQVDSLNGSPRLERVPADAVPDWSLLQKPDATYDEIRDAFAVAQQYCMMQQGIIESSHATQVIQNLVIKKVNLSLHGKEERDKEKKRSHFPKGLGRAVTHDGLDKEMEDEARRKEIESKEKDKGKQRRAAKKKAKEDAAAKWAAMKAAYEAELQAWTLDCEGKPKREWKARPKRGKKPQPEEVPSSSEDGSGSEDDMDLD